MATYRKDVDLQALMDAARAAGNYREAALLEQERNAKIKGEGLPYETTSKYQGHLDDTDYSTILKQQMAAGAGADEVESILGKRVDKALGTEGLQQYAYDDIYAEAMRYVTQQRNSPAAFSYASAPTYADKYADQIDALTQALLNRDPFSYDYTGNPQYSAIKKQTMREADRTQRDTLGSLATMTGGIPSSAAITAASQAGDYAKSKATDVIPELYQAALAKYQAEDAMARGDIGLLMGQQQFDYGMFQDELGQFNTDRGFAYGQHLDEGDYRRYLDETAYERSAYEDETEYSRLLAQAELMASVAGDFSGFAALGYTNDQIATLTAAAQAAQTSKGSGRGSGSSGGSGDDSLFEAMKASGSPYTFLASNYSNYKVAYSSIDRVYSEYQDWLENQGEDDDTGISNITGKTQSGEYDWVHVPGYGRLSFVELEALVNSGKIIETYDEKTGTYKYRKAS